MVMEIRKLLQLLKGCTVQENWLPSTSVLVITRSGLVRLCNLVKGRKDLGGRADDAIAHFNYGDKATLDVYF